MKSNELMMSKWIRATLALACLTCLMIVLAPGDARAQTSQPPGNVGIGGQIGSPSGITVKWYDGPGRAYDLLGAWDLNDFFFLNLHMLFERPLTDSPLNLFYGPGAYIGVQERRRENEVVVGISGNFGLNFFTERFEVFLQLTPRLNVVPDTHGRLGGGVGLRYYF
jgi:hypothetical protein